MNAQEAYELAKPAIQLKRQEELAQSNVELATVLDKIKESALLGETSIGVNLLHWSTTAELISLGYTTEYSMGKTHVYWNKPVKLVKSKNFINKLLDLVGY